MGTKSRKSRFPLQPAYVDVNTSPLGGLVSIGLIVVVLVII